MSGPYPYDQAVPAGDVTCFNSLAKVLVPSGSLSRYQLKCIDFQIQGTDVKRLFMVHQSYSGQGFTS